MGDSGTTGVTGQAGDALELNTPNGVTLDSAGNLYIADTVNNVIRKVTPAGVITTVAGLVSYSGNSFNGDGGSATLAAMNKPSALLYDAAGDLYIADTRNNAIRFVNAKTGIITTVAGTGNPTGAYTGDNGPARVATLNAPVGIALDSSGNLYIADTGNNVIRKVTSSGTITTVAGNGNFGSGGSDGVKATFAALGHPKGVAVDSAGNIYFSDSLNNKIRVVTPNGTISTIAGTGQVGWTGDGGPAISAQFSDPTQITIDAKGNLYVADTGNNVIRLLTPGSSSGAGQPPAISAGGVITASAFGAAPSVAPGSWIEIYGTNLAARRTRSWTTADFHQQWPDGAGGAEPHHCDDCRPAGLPGLHQSHPGERADTQYQRRHATDDHRDGRGEQRELQRQRRGESIRGVRAAAIRRGAGETG